MLSAGDATIEHMFDELVAAAGGSRGAESLGAWARVENAACACRLDAMLGVLDARHAADGSAERDQWCIDNWSAVCAEIGAAHNLTSGSASNQLLVATALRDRLPRVNALFAEGRVGYRLVSLIVWRTALIVDLDALAAVDRRLALVIGTWGPMSEAKTVAAIDTWVERSDPHALRRSQRSSRSRDVNIHLDEGSGMGSLFGTLFAHDAKALDERLAAMANQVCQADPRTMAQCRADALGALAAGAEQLTCECGTDDCPSAVGPSPVVVFVVAHDDTLTDTTDAAAAQDVALNGSEPAHPSGKPLREMTLAEAGRDPIPPGFAATTPGVMIGGPVLPGPVLRRAAARAAIRRVFHPGDTPPEPRYRPSARLVDFVRCRDLTCRFPGCDVPASGCDVDHTIPYPVGPTQASNLKCLCRRHHLLKTFWGSDGGWRDRQSPDGTVVWTSPNGQTHLTQPGSWLLFPGLCKPTAAVVATANSTGVSTPGLTVPRRTRTRAQDRARRIEVERTLNGLAPERVVGGNPVGSIAPGGADAPCRPREVERPAGSVRPRGRQPTTEISVYRWTA